MESQVREKDVCRVLDAGQQSESESENVDNCATSSENEGKVREEDACRVLDAGQQSEGDSENQETRATNGKNNGAPWETQMKTIDRGVRACGSGELNGSFASDSSEDSATESGDVGSCPGEKVCVAADAGAGKSYLARAIVFWAVLKNYFVLVLSPTGMGAMNLCGSTIHRFLGLKVRQAGSWRDILNLETMTKSTMYLIQSACGIIVDEFQAGVVHVFDALDQACQYAKNNGEPYGGLWVWFFGDPQQRLPVIALEARARVHNFFFYKK